MNDFTCGMEISKLAIYNSKKYHSSQSAANVSICGAIFKICSLKKYIFKMAFLKIDVFKIALKLKNRKWIPLKRTSWEIKLSSCKLKMNSYILRGNFKVPSLKNFVLNKFIIFLLLFLKINLYIFDHNILHQNLHSKN